MSRALRIILPALALLLISGVLCALGAMDAVSTTAAAKAEMSVIDLYILAGPIEWGVLTPLSIITVALGLQWILTIKHETLIPPGMADELHNVFAEGVTDEAVENARNLVANDRSMLGNIVATMLDKKDFGYNAMKEATEIAGAAESNKYMSKVSWLSMFASSATLLGLLGTVSGIIKSFLKMGSSSGAVDPSMLAASIGEALVCTGTGLAIAIMGLYMFFFLRNRVNQATLDCAVLSSEILDYFRPPNH
jgi:biopolymer transport protein ExbB